MALWTKRKPLKDKDRFSTDIYMTRLNLLKDGQPRVFQLTNSQDTDHSPLVSSDNETIYFLSSRKKGKKLWSLSTFGGEAQEVSTFKNGISSINWLNDSTIIYLSNDGKSLYDQKNEKSKDDTQVVEDSLHWEITKVYAYGLKDKSIKRLTNNDFPVIEYAISPKGSHLVTAHVMSPHYEADAQPKNTYFIKDLNSGKSTRILTGLGEPGNFVFTSSGNGFYFLATTSSDYKWRGAGISELYYFDISSMTSTKVDLSWAKGVGQGFEVIGDNVMVSLANNATMRLAYYIKKGTTWQKNNVSLQGAMADHTHLLGALRSGSKLAFSFSTASKLPEYYVGNVTLRKGVASFSKRQKLANLNQNLRKKNLTKSEIFTWTGANGDEVNGILYYPKNYEEGTKYPLILSIHGGPSAVTLDRWTERWSTYPNLFAEKGAFVLKPNYHGSSNHGQAFVESIKANYYDQEMTDIVNGINVLNEQGRIDMDKLGVMGWSNGAILTTMLTLRYPDMFKAAAPGAGDINWTSDFGTCRFGVSFDQYYFGGAPWDNKDGKTYNENYILQSPLFEIEKIKTPTIIFHGSNDRAVPRDQGWEYYRALQQVGKAPVKFLWFPGQPHGLQKITHQTRKMQEEIAWFDKYLFETYEKPDEALKEDSPLALALAMSKVARVNGLFGVKEKDFLAPEMVRVEKDSISIGRFEITNAQFKAYQSNHTYRYGTANEPVHNLEKKDIDGYISWLNQLTGNTYRLPNKKEATALHELARNSKSNENTFNYWAGYEINPRDADELSKKTEDMNKSLVMKVGSFQPTNVGNAKVYDIKGNVSEYYSDGQILKTYGYSAYDYVDPNNSTNPVNSKYTGFRLIQD